MHPVYYLYPYFPRFFEICQSERKYNSEADLISVLYQISAQKNAFKILTPQCCAARALFIL